MGWWEHISALFDNKAIAIPTSAVIGALLWALRGRLRTLEYTVRHEPIGTSASGAFGAIKVTWQETQLPNLYLSVLTLRNPTTTDLTDVRIAAFTPPETLLLSEEAHSGAYPLKFEPEFQERVNVATGAKPTDDQWRLYSHRREYIVPVLNRKQDVLIHYLTTVIQDKPGPVVSLSVQHKGVKLEYRPMRPEHLGAPIRIAAVIGLVASLLILAATILWISSPLYAAIVCMTFGLFALNVGAALYHVGRFITRLVAH